MSAAPLDARSLAALAARYQLPPDTLVPLAHVVVRSELELTLEPGAVLCTQNEPADAIYLLLEGSLRVRRRLSGNTLTDIARATPPAVLGHMALMLSQRRSAALVAGPEGARVVVLPKSAVDPLLEGTSDRSDALRRLVLAAQLDQHHRAVSDILRQLDMDAPLPAGWAAPAS